MICRHELGHMAMMMILGVEVKEVSVAKSARAKVLGKCVPKSPLVISMLIRSSGVHPDDPESVKLFRKFMRLEHVASEFDFDALILNELQIAHAGFCAEMLFEVDRRCPEGRNYPTKKAMIDLVKGFVRLNSQSGTDLSDDFSRINVLLALHSRSNRIHSAAITATLSALSESKTQIVMKQLLPKLMTAGKLSRRDIATAQAGFQMV